MRLDDIKPSDQVEDRRGGGVGGGGGGFGFPGGGGGMQIPIGASGGGFSISTIVLLAIAYFALKIFFGVDLLSMMNGGGGFSVPGGGQITIPSGSTTVGQTDQGASQVTPTGQADVTGDSGKIFVAKVLATTEMVWGDIFKQMGQQYEKPKLVLFNGVVQSACGMAQSAMGPFYCPEDHKVYIDLSFYNDMKTKLGAPGDFAQAYVVAHEVGHHVQTLLGITDKVNQARSQASEVESNALSVRTELQADCFAGIWAKKINAMGSIVQPGDVDEALNAASQIGDDRLQKRAQGYAVPDTFTHGTSAERVKWFKTGLQANSLNDCDTFGASSLD